MKARVGLYKGHVSPGISSRMISLIVSMVSFVEKKIARPWKFIGSSERSGHTKLIRPSKSVVLNLNLSSSPVPWRAISSYPFGKEHYDPAPSPTEVTREAFAGSDLSL